MWGGDGDLDADESLGGDGTPMVAAFAPEPFGLALGVSTDTAKTLLADALDLVHRLPHTWRRLQTLEVPVWRGRRLAQKTHSLNVKAAAHVDRLLAPRLHTVGVTRLDRAIAHAIAKYMPEEHADREARSRQTWDVTLHHPNPTEFAGTSELHITGDTMTLTNLYDQICRTAADLKTAGDDDPLGVRKAKALRTLTGTPKTKLYLHLDPAVSTGSTTEPGRPGREPRTRHHRQDPRLARRHPGHHPARAPDGPGRRRRRPRPARLDARPGHPPRPHLRLPPLRTQQPSLRPRPHRALRRTRPTRPNPTSQPRAALPATPPRQDQRQMDLPAPTRRHLRLE